MSRGISLEQIEVPMSNIPKEFPEWKQKIASELSRQLEQNSDYDAIHFLGNDGLARLAEYTIAGKMIRGGLVCLGALFGESIPESAYLAGAAIELFQSALLVHDDIMDRDPVRRGLTSVHTQYSSMAEFDKVVAAGHIGQSLAICLGDIAFFIAFEIIAKLELPDATRTRILALSARELQYVGVAQMADVYRGALLPGSPQFVSTDGTAEALRVYLYKTGRYTFSLPMMIGALISNQAEEIVITLEKLGEQIGVLFQIKDDEIGLFGDPQEVGKPIGSDIREGKKTIFYSELTKRVEADELHRFDSLMGNDGAPESDLAWATRLIERSGTRAAVDEISNEYATAASRTIDTLDQSPRAREILAELLEFNIRRTR